jgi:hypothetical protein
VRHLKAAWRRIVADHPLIAAGECRPLRAEIVGEEETPGLSSISASAPPPLRRGARCGSRSARPTPSTSRSQFHKVEEADTAFGRGACHRGRAREVAPLECLDAVDGEQPAARLGFDDSDCAFEPRPGAALRTDWRSQVGGRGGPVPAWRDRGAPRRAGRGRDIRARHPRPTRRLASGAPCASVLERPLLAFRALVDAPLACRDRQAERRELRRGVELLPLLRSPGPPVPVSLLDAADRPRVVFDFLSSP